MKKIISLLVIVVLVTACSKTSEVNPIQSPEIELTETEEVSSNKEELATVENKDEGITLDDDKTHDESKEEDSKKDQTDHKENSSKPVNEAPESNKASNSGNTTIDKADKNKTDEKKPSQIKPVEPKPTQTKPAESKPKDVIVEKYIYERVDVIAPSEEIRKDSNLEEGTKRYESGYEGYTEKKILVTYTNGKEIGRKVVESNTVAMVPNITFEGTKKPAPVTLSHDINESKELFRLLNEVRKAEGKHLLTWSDELYAAALVRANEIVEVFSHDRPDGSSFSTALPPFGTAGENIASGQRKPSVFNNAWNNSPGHFANRISDGFNKYGAAILKFSNGGSVGVELFTD